jgi:hypothetical protein
VSVFVSKEEGKEGVAVSDDCAMCIDQIHRVGMYVFGCIHKVLDSRPGLAEIFS